MDQIGFTAPAAWQAKESFRELYTYCDPGLVKDHLDALINDFTDGERPPEGPTPQATFAVLA